MQAAEILLATVALGEYVVGFKACPSSWCLIAADAKLASASAKRLVSSTKPRVSL